MNNLFVGSQYDICDTSELSTGGIGTSGYVVSPRYPRDMVQSKTCRITIIACAECSITLNFTSLQLPNCNVSDWPHGNCVYGLVLTLHI